MQALRCLRACAASVLVDDGHGGVHVGQGPDAAAPPFSHLTPAAAFAEDVGARALTLGAEAPAGAAVCVCVCV